MAKYNATLELPSEQITPGFMDSGIHENAKMTNVEYKVTPSSEILVFHFVNEQGETGTHTEWVPKGKDDADQLSKEMNQMSRIKQIVKTFVPETKFVFSADSFKEFAEKTIAILGDSYLGVKIRVKFVYSGKYTSLPKYWKMRFIERMDNNGYYGDKIGESKVKILSIDDLKRIPDAAPTNQNPFGQGEAPANRPNVNTDDLPF